MADITAPNAGAYGIWGPQYAAALAAQSGSPVAGPLNMLAMRGYMGQEQGGYGAALDQTQVRQLEAARMAEETARMEAAAGAIPAGIQYGGLDALMPFLAANGIALDPTASTARDALVTQDISAGAFRDRSAGVADVAEAGYAPAPADINETLMPSVPTAAPAEYAPYMSPANLADAERARAAIMQGQAAITSSNRPQSSGGGGSNSGDVDITMAPDSFGVMRPTIKYNNVSPDRIAAITGGAGTNASGGNESQRTLTLADRRRAEEAELRRLLQGNRPQVR